MALHEKTATWLARLGFAARGLVYLLVGWFALDAAFRGGRAVDNQGAIVTLADQPLGHVLLAVVAAGLAGYALWRLAEGLALPARAGRDAKALFRRIGHLVSGVAHVVLAWTAATLAIGVAERGSLSPGDARARDATAWLLAHPFGQVLVGVVALGFLAAAAQQAKRAWNCEFMRDLRGDAPTPHHVQTIGRIGYAARALVFAIVALFFVGAAWRARASAAGGIGDALRALQAQTGGQWLLAVTGVGLALFGVYSLVEARYRRIHVDLPG